MKFVEGNYYLGVLVGLDIKDKSNWEPLKFKNGYFMRTGNTCSYTIDSFARVLTSPIYDYVTIAQNLKKQILEGDKLNLSISVKSDDEDIAHLLKELNTLKDDKEGNITMTDPDRENKVQTVYRLLDKIRMKEFL